MRGHDRRAADDVPARVMKRVRMRGHDRRAADDVPARVMKRVSALLLGWMPRAGLSATAPDRAGAWRS